MIVRPFGPTGVRVGVMGQGTWHLGEDKRIRRDEVTAFTLTPEDLSAIAAGHRR